MIAPKPICFEKIWGYENWIVSAYEGASQKDFTDAFGSDFPLLVKVIQADERLSVQLHPDDEAAVLLEGDGCRGKTECWYVLDAMEGASLICGLKKDCAQEDLRGAIRENRLEDYLNAVPVRKGDFVFIPAGAVHAIGGGIRLLEVQQSSDITYRLYDWGRPRELHVEKGLSALKNAAAHIEKPFSGRFDCRYFSLETLRVSGRTDVHVPDVDNARRPELLFVISGTGSAAAGGQTIALAPESFIAAAPHETVMIEGTLELMRIRCAPE
ncbi:MAG: type I phosphomannose isomerase catalytic subunit [Treponema sp.]